MTDEEKKDRANLKKVGRIHGVALLAALTLWGAADTWAAVSGWGLATVVAIANAALAATAITGILHEWGHYAGARLAGSTAHALEKPVNYFFMFNFPFDQNDTRQFLWMSWGGILTPWLLVLLTLILIPIDNASRAMLLAVFVMRAVQVALFEVPVATRARNSRAPQKELERQLIAGFQQSRIVGAAAGVLAFLVA